MFTQKSSIRCEFCGKVRWGSQCQYSWRTTCLNCNGVGRTTGELMNHAPRFQGQSTKEKGENGKVCVSRGTVKWAGKEGLMKTHHHGPSAVKYWRDSDRAWSVKKKELADNFVYWQHAESLRHFGSIKRYHAYRLQLWFVPTVFGRKGRELLIREVRLFTVTKKKIIIINIKNNTENQMTVPRRSWSLEIDLDLRERMIKLITSSSRHQRGRIIEVRYRRTIQLLYSKGTKGDRGLWAASNKPSR